MFIEERLCQIFVMSSFDQNIACAQSPAFLKKKKNIGEQFVFGGERAAIHRLTKIHVQQNPGGNAPLRVNGNWFVVTVPILFQVSVK